MTDITKSAIQTVINKAWDDHQFRENLIQDPKASIKAATGLNVPSDFNLKFTDQTDASKVFINIPPKPDFDDMELTDEQLEEVAGGEIFATAFTVAFVVPIVVASTATVAAAGGAAAAGISAGW